MFFHVCFKQSQNGASMNLQTFQDFSWEHNAELRSISEFYFFETYIKRVNFVNNLQKSKLPRIPHSIEKCK